MDENFLTRKFPELRYYYYTLLPPQKRDAITHNPLVRVSLFLINSYVARLIIGIVAIVIITAAAFVNMAQCEIQTLSSNSSDSCNCTTWEKWEEAVNSPNPDDRSCQFPQVCELCWNNWGKFTLLIREVTKERKSGAAPLLQF